MSNSNGGNDSSNRWIGFTMRRFAFFFGLVGAVYYIYKGDKVGALCFGGISAIALISKGISFVKKARRAGK